MLNIKESRLLVLGSSNNYSLAPVDPFVNRCYLHNNFRLFLK